MKKIIFVLLSMSILLSFSACNNEDVVSESEDSRVLEYIKKLPFPEISISIPPDYETASSQYLDEFYKKGQASIIVTSETVSGSERNMDAKAYDIQYKYEQIADTVDITSETPLEINGCESRIMEMRYSITGKDSVLNMSCCFGLIMGKSNFYIITCSVPTDQYALFADEFKSIIKSAVTEF